MVQFDLSKKILEKIKNEHIEPKAKWQFTFKNALVWIVGSMALLFGGLASSVLVYMLANNDWDLYQHISGGLAQFIFITMPYYWLAFVLFFIIAAYYYLRHTKKGYRYRLGTISAFILLSSAVLGIIFYNIGMGEAIEGVFAKKVPFYKELTGHRNKLWRMADEGRIAGEVSAIIDASRFRFKEINSKEWIVLTDGAIVPTGYMIKPGDKLKMLGNKINEEEFQALIIKPFGMPFSGMLENRRNIERELLEHPDLRQKINDPNRRPGMMRLMEQGRSALPCERSPGCLRTTIIEDLKVL